MRGSGQCTEPASASAVLGSFLGFPADSTAPCVCVCVFRDREARRRAREVEKMAELTEFRGRERRAVTGPNNL